MSEKKDPSVIGMVIMCSGAGRRFGGNKLLADLGGKPLIGHVLDVSLAAAREMDRKAFSEGGPHIDGPTAVTRWQPVRDEADRRGAACILHADPYQSDTLRHGLEGAEDKGWTGCIFLTGDQPFLTKESVERLLDAVCGAPDEVWRLSAKGVPGNPVYFPARLFSALRAIEGERGGGSILPKDGTGVRFVEVPERELFDIDTPEALDAARLMV